MIDDSEWEKFELTASEPKVATVAPTERNLRLETWFSIDFNILLTDENQIIIYFTITWSILKDDVCHNWLVIIKHQK